MAPPNRKQVNRLPPERRIADIMVAARDVFTEKGYNDALISDIAKRAGVVEGSIYRFFRNKHELLVRVIEHWYEQMLAHDDVSFSSIDGTRNKIRFLVHHHLTSIRKEPGLTRLMLQVIRPETDYRQTNLFELNQAYSKRIMEVVKAAINNGEFRSDVSPVIVRDIVYGCIEHRVWAFLRNEGKLEIRQTADQITDIVYRGLSKDGAPEKSMDADSISRLEQAVRSLETMANGRRKPAK